MKDPNDLNRFPVLSSDSNLHVYKTHCLIKSEKTTKSRRISLSLFHLLKEFDGTRILKTLMTTWLETQSKIPQRQLCEDLLKLNYLIFCGVVTFYNREMSTGVSIIRSDVYYQPESMHIELTSKCNFKCFYCYRNSSPSVSEDRLPTKLLIDILKELSTEGMQAVELTGGEPLLHPDFLEIVSFCAENFTITSVLTNGYLLSKKIIKSLLQYRDQIAFGISLDSHRAAEHDRRCCVNGAFTKVTGNIVKLTSFGFLVRIAMAVDEDNWDDIEPTVILSKKLGVKSFTYSPILPFGRGNNGGNGFKFWRRDPKSIFETEKNLHDNYPGFLHKLDEYQTDRLSKEGGCGAGHRSYAMDPIGNVRLCVTFDADNAIIGNLANQLPEEVFSGELCKLSAQIKAPSPGVCDPCPYTSFCNNCILRGSYALNYIGKENCKWIKTANISRWLDLIQLHSTSELTKITPNNTMHSDAHSSRR